jgi:sugar/nucleoside kinase (ribokinase family)
MSLVVVGTIALDSVETPTERRDDVMGGSAVYFSYAASYFTSVRLVGVVGDDWPADYTQLLAARNVDTAGLTVVPGGKTFRWRGRYHRNMNDRDTLDTQLNVFADFDPVLPDAFRRMKFLFLANGPPPIQLKVLDQMTGATLTVADTMDLWINSDRATLVELLKRIDGLVLNDAEAMLLTGEDNLVRAGHKICAMGPRFVVVKKGEHGAMFFSEHETYVLPAYPVNDVVDPTGAGDTFAGGMMGYLAERDDYQPRTLKEAMAYGIVAASFNVEGFGIERLLKIKREDLDRRFATLRKMLTF